ncbi:serine hydrolase [Aneurinibacillus migulanus]|uniref:CubicO group peptidase, beta-lactamase class C family n=2 Tax=Aneurinibacillus migulanus TaxID=47500 RepID=A0A0D1WGZ2_ANEMI|nr:serine hydrolase [Aneurinibacillus migulanus]KIV57855.1 pilus assembly protein [Aneurinibacillus migulanus]KON97388.1 pilus assembly protein [Aneurinibacillus migulanus]MED0893927.1 beta-lactamase family protein [Aneurinibacillus migulanus]MED1616692.1 beta-lactamase family protein [Aneurinibacillus migulanus]SDI99538.1 CubicO group peptidase, beta-lactamase class C family [Aneurinibacillus migulanus]
MLIRKSFRKKLIHIFLTMIVAVFTFAPYAYGSSVKEMALGPTDAKEVEEFADTFFSQPHIKDQLAGAVFVIVKDGKILLKKGYGYADLEKKIPADPDRTVFPVASISKVFTATGIMQLVEQGKINLDEDIQTYLGDVKLKNKTDYPLTMKHLLTHTTGFDFTDTLESAQHRPEPLPLDKYVKENMSTVIRKPGEAFRYDNFASMLQGYILQNVSGKSFNQYITENIYQPLEMKNSSFLLTPEIKAKLATGYNAANKPFPVYTSNPIEQPEGGMFSTGKDMAAFMMAHLNKGTIEGHKILDKDTAEMMQSIHYAIHPKLPNMAYGFETYYHSSHNNQFVIGKGGDLPGAHSWMWLLPEQRVGGFIVFNKDIDFREELFKAFMDRYYPMPKKEQKYVASTQEQLKRFEGVYRDLRVNPWVTKITATQQGQLLAEDPMGKNTLRQVEPLLFKDEEGTLLAFKETDDGRVAYLQYHNPVSLAERLPASKQFSDVPTVHPYAAYIKDVQQFGVLPGDTDGFFYPEAPVTRAEFVGELIRLIGVRASTHPVIFTDTKNNKYAKEIQAAVEANAIKGVTKNTFEPNRPITRQEAAAIIWGVSQALIDAQPADAPLAGEVDPWAIQAVKYAAANKLYGPEVTSSEKGMVDYKAKKPLLRQEAAALFYTYARHMLGG